MCPMAYAMVTTVRPNASATPSNPIPTPGNAADSPALPQPPSTSQNVPMNSARSRFDNGINGMFVPHPFATLFVLLYGPRGAAASGSYALSAHPGNAAKIHCGCETRALLSMPESYMIFPLRIYLAALAMLLPLLATAASQTSVPAVRLYTLDCGTLEFKDLRLFSDTGEYDGQ